MRNFLKYFSKFPLLNRNINSKGRESHRAKICHSFTLNAGSNTKLNLSNKGVYLLMFKEKSCLARGRSCGDNYLE